MGENLQVYIEEACNFIDNIDQPLDFVINPGFYVDGTVCACKGGVNQPGKRIPKVGAKAEAGFGRAKVEASVLGAELRGPNAQASAGVSPVAAVAMVRAELLSAKCSLGPVHFQGGAGFDTGGSLGFHGMEVKFLGCGFTLGRKNSLALFGSEVGFTLPAKVNANVEYMGKEVLAYPKE
ncbi:hypothetical protein ANANG_G00249880 [Anguilla anguilla]|uniref:Uncharacterized protein n=1 Tax=Anguilla anguilla TaxID=7936 RepID=A0A9D3RQG0_ANGAN|nr:hypothetical protein ANANG_G00249880 [Anguilla anguilla]